MRKEDRARLRELRTARWDGEDAAWVLALAEREGVALARLASEHGLSPKRLYWWRRRLEGRARSTEPDGHFVPVRVVPGAAPVAAAESGVAVETASGHRIHVARDFDAATLTRVIDALAEAC
jgi:transposase-like protein